MRGRWLIAAVLCCSLAAVGCGGDDSSKAKDDNKASGDTTTTAAGGTGGEDSSTTLPPPETVPDDDFTKVVEDINARVEAAGADPCKVLEAFGSSAPTPANAAQTEQAVNVIAQVLVKLADSSPPEAAAAAETVRTTAKSLPEQAASVGFDPEKVNTLPGLSSPEFGAAIGTIQTAAKCGAPTGG